MLYFLYASCLDVSVVSAVSMWHTYCVTKSLGTLILAVSFEAQLSPLPVLPVCDFPGYQG